MNRTVLKPYRELRDSEGRPDEEVALEFWQSHCLREASTISNKIKLKLIFFLSYLIVYLIVYLRVRF